MTSEKRKAALIAKYGKDLGWAKLIISSKWIGAFTMGIMPLTVYLLAFPETTLAQLGLGFDSKFIIEIIIWTLLLGGLAIVLTRYNAKKSKSLEVYPQIRAKKWDRKMVRGNLMGWAVYMMGYEIMFRGVLLFPLVESIGVWPAIAINIVISSATHIQKGLTETLSTILLTLVFCLLSIHTGSIWIALMVHIIIALSNTSVALKNHPDMEVVKSLYM